jgi:hypothetical protein
MHRIARAHTIQRERKREMCLTLPSEKAFWMNREAKMPRPTSTSASTINTPAENNNVTHTKESK